MTYAPPIKNNNTKRKMNDDDLNLNGKEEENQEGKDATLFFHFKKPVPYIPIEYMCVDR